MVEQQDSKIIDDDVHDSIGDESDINADDF